MNLRIESFGTTRYVACPSTEQCIGTAADFLDILSFGSENNTILYLLDESNFPTEFYDLKTGLAGEIFQKCSNYLIRMAIVGSFTHVENKRFRELMFEANKGRDLRFAENRNDAIAWLAAGRDR